MSHHYAGAGSSPQSPTPTDKSLNPSDSNKENTVLTGSMSEAGDERLNPCSVNIGSSSFPASQASDRANSDRANTNNISKRHPQEGIPASIAPDEKKNVLLRQRRRGYFDIIAACFVAFLLLSNISATKLISFEVAGWHPVFDGGAVLFPLTYILGDLLSEVYGLRNARRVIFTGFAVQIIASLTFWLVQLAPPDNSYPHQEAFEAVLGQVPRLVLASLLAYLVGQLLNSFVLVRMKERYGESRLWARLLGSTLAGEAADSLVFCVVAWIGVVPLGTIVNLMVVGFFYKVTVEVVFLPMTYFVVGLVKRTDPTYVSVTSQ